MLISSWRKCSNRRAIEVITSKKRKIKITNDDGIEQTVHVLVWNPTLANLSLLALGSSAPEILLSCIETVQNLNQPPGELGPSTIVGSAAFNLLVISAVAVVAVKGKGPKKIYDMGVFIITAVSSLFAYIWLYIVLQVWTEGEVTIAEAAITFAFFIILLVAAFIADKVNACLKRKSEGKLGITARGGNFDVDDFMHLLAMKKEDATAEGQSSKHEEIQKFFKKKFGDKDPQSLTREELEEKLSPESGIQEKIKFRRGFGDLVSGRHTNGVSLQKNQKYFKEEKMAKDAADKQAKKYNLLVGFKCLHYSVSEAIGTLQIQVIKKIEGEPITVGVRTKNGTAVAGEDFTSVDEELVFAANEQVKSVSVKIINDDCYEENEDFFVEIYDPQSNE